MLLSSPVQLTYIPKKIISLVPSQTELLHYLGLEEATAGITKFCIHPKDWHLTKQKVGGTKTLNLPLIKELGPDLIIANKEENTKEQVEELAASFPVWVTDVNDLETALQMIGDIGQLTHKTIQANFLIEEIKNRFNELKPQPSTFNLQPSTAYLIWRKPWMAAGGGTFINDMLKLAGFKNIFSGISRYPEINIDQLTALNCELLLLSSEPYPFKQKHIDELQALLPNTSILLTDGEMFSWYGSRLLQAPEYFNELHAAINRIPQFADKIYL